jgi:hypothetical protein
MSQTAGNLAQFSNNPGIQEHSNNYFPINLSAPCKHLAAPNPNLPTVTNNHLKQLVSVLPVARQIRLEHRCICWMENKINFFWSYLTFHASIEYLYCPNNILLSVWSPN